MEMNDILSGLNSCDDDCSDSMSDSCSCGPSFGGPGMGCFPGEVVVDKELLAVDLVAGFGSY